MSLSGSMHERMYGGQPAPSFGGAGMYSSIGRVQSVPQRVVQYGQPQLQPSSYGQPASYGQSVYSQEPPPVSVNSFLQPGMQTNMQTSMQGMQGMQASMQGMQGMQASMQGMQAMQASMQSREGMMLRSEQERLRSEGEGVIRMNTELTGSRVECERLASTLRGNEAGNQQISEEYRMLRQMMEQKENEYRRLWSAEETRIRNISEDTRRHVDNIRSNLIGALEKMDVTNKNMLETTESLMQLDREMDALARAGGV